MSKNGWDTVTPEMISYGIIGVLAINISCFIASLMLRYNNDLMNKINADNKEIVENNIRLEAEVKTGPATYKTATITSNNLHILCRMN